MLLDQGLCLRSAFYSIYLMSIFWVSMVWSDNLCTFLSKASNRLLISDDSWFWSTCYFAYLTIAKLEKQDRNAIELDIFIFCMYLIDIFFYLLLDIKPRISHSAMHYSINLSMYFGILYVLYALFARSRFVLIIWDINNAVQVIQLRDQNRIVSNTYR